MALTQRGKVFIGIGVAVALVIGVVVVMAAFGRGPDFVQSAVGAVTGTDPSPEPTPCPLTGEEPAGGTVPARPALAVKVENDPIVRPQDGLNDADIVYEQEVEGGITRFIVVFQCTDSKRIWPIRSGRTSDPDVLTQFGTTVFAYADAANYVKNAVKKAGDIVDIRWEIERDAYQEDPAKDAPHQLYSSTKDLYKAAGKKIVGVGAPEMIYAYSETFPDVKSRSAKSVEVNFSESSDVIWKYKGGVYERYHGSEQHTSSGSPVTADNVLIQILDYEDSGHVDVVGNPVPEAQHIGEGKAYLLRDGKVISGKWNRPGPNGITHFTTKSGEPFLFKPGNTWVELYPSDDPKPKF